MDLQFLTDPATFLATAGDHLAARPRGPRPGRGPAGGQRALPAAQVFADELGRLTGRTPRVRQHTRLQELGELGELVEPAPVPGALRPAEPDDLDLCRAWFTAFHPDADEQAGRAPGRAPIDTVADETCSGASPPGGSGCGRSGERSCT